MKQMLLGAIQQHKESHMAMIDIRTSANVYVDTVIEKYRNLLEVALADSHKCNWINSNSMKFFFITVKWKNNYLTYIFIFND